MRFRFTALSLALAACSASRNQPDAAATDHMLMALFDANTGRLTWDETDRSPDGSLGINFTRDDWPHGRTGPAFAHAALFRP